MVTKCTCFIHSPVGCSDSSDNEEAGVNHEIKEQVIDENLPPYLTEIPMDTLICPNIGNREGNVTLIELITSAVVSCDKANWEKHMKILKKQIVMIPQVVWNLSRLKNLH